MNIALAREGVQAADGDVPVRLVLSAPLTRFLSKPGVADDVARRYAETGIDMVDLRPSPLGADDEGRRKIRDLLAVLDVFRRQGLEVVLGLQGVFGPAALGLGLADAFSVGIGYREHYDFSRALTQQRNIAQGQSSGHGPHQGVFVPKALRTIDRAVARELYASREIRTSLRCNLGGCAERLDGPVQDPRRHYLHARADSTHDLLRQPEPWRPTLMKDQLDDAVQMRRRLNSHLPESAHPLKMTTLENLRREIDVALDQAA